MAVIDTEEDDYTRQRNPNPAQPPPPVYGPYNPSPSPAVPTSTPQLDAHMHSSAPQSSGGGGGEPDWAEVERRLRQVAGNLYDPSDLEGVRRNYSNQGANQGNLEANINAQAGIYDVRRGPTSHRPYDSQTTNSAQQSANAAADQRAGVNRTPVSSAIESALAALSNRPQEMPGYTATSPAYGAMYSQVYNMMQQAAKENLGGYFTQPEIDAHLRNMGWRGDRDPDANVRRSVQNWVTQTLPREQESVAYRNAIAAQQQAARTPQAAAPSQPAAARPSQPASAFSDPVGGPVNDFANERFSRLTNPPADSGQALLEEALRKMAAQFENGGYTNNELENFQTQAIDPLERLRTARKQQVIQNLSQRGIPYNPAAPGGVAKAMLDDVDRQFDTLRAQQQTQIGTQAANESRARMLQSLEMLSGLASTQEGRLDKAFNYRTVPLGLADRSFSQAMQLYGQANPMNLFNPAMQLASMGQNQQNNQGNILAWLAQMLMNGG